MYRDFLETGREQHGAACAAQFGNSVLYNPCPDFFGKQKELATTQNEAKREHSSSGAAR